MELDWHQRGKKPMDPKNTSERNPVEAIASDYAESVRGGKRLSVDSVANANPQHESELRDLLPLIEKLEQARQTHIQRPAGLATLGVSRPERLGDFQLVRQIGRGGMGVVFEAVQKSLGRRVALKVLPSSLLPGGEPLRRFEQEARTAAALHHTNIVPVFGVGQDQGFHYFVMQRIDGYGLDALLQDQERQLTPQQVAKLGAQAASALAYAHHQHVLHRDIKPANLLVNQNLDLWVTDFGVAKAVESEAVTRTGDVVGTLRYMAPEQVVGEADVRSDIYSLGITLYELLAGRPAIDDSSIRQAIVTRRPAPSPPPLRQLNAEVPIDLETILQTAMSNDPTARYQTAGAFKRDLEAFLDGNAISVRRVPVWERVHRWGKRNPAVAALSAVSMILLASVAILSSAGLFQLQAAFEREQQNRQKAEQIAEVAVGTVDQIFQRFAGGMENTEPEKEFAAAPAISSETAEMLENLLPFYDEIDRLSFSDGVGTPQLQQSTAGAQSAVAELHFSLGHYQRAIDTFQEMLVKQSAQSGKSGEELVQLAKLRNRLGFAFRMLGEDDTAAQEHQLALETLTQVASVNEPADVATSRSTRFEIARTHYLLALHVLPGMGPTAMPTVDVLRSTRFDDRAGLPKGFEADFGRPGGPRLNAPGGPRPGRPGGPRPGRPDGPRPELDGLGEPPRAPGHPLHDQLPPPRRGEGRDGQPGGRRSDPVRVQHLQIAISILRELIEEDPENLSYALSLARSLRQQEHDVKFRPRQGDGLSSRESVVLLRDLKQKHPQNQSVLFELSEALADHQLFSAGDPTYVDSITQLTEAAETFTLLCEVHPNVPKYINAMVHTHFKLAMLMERESQEASPQEKRELKSQATDALRRAVDGYAVQVQMHPDALGYRAWYALFLYKDGKNSLASGFYDQAIASLQKSVEEWNQVIESNPDDRISWRALPDVYRSLGQAFEAIGKQKEATDAFAMAAVSQQMIDLGP